MLIKLKYAEDVGHPEKALSNPAFGTLQRADVLFQLRLTLQNIFPSMLLYTILAHPVESAADRSEKPACFTR